MLQDKIRALRMERKISQTTLARKLHVTQGAISQWENGVTSPDTGQLIALSEVFGVSLDSLVGSVSEEKSKTDGSFLDGLTKSEKAAIDHLVWLLKNGSNRSLVDHAVFTIDSVYKQETEK